MTGNTSSLNRWLVIASLHPICSGHGRSPNPRHDFKFVDVSRDVFALLDHLGIDRVKAIGLSAGANTLLHMATAAATTQWPR